MWPAKVTEVAEGRFFKRTVALFGSGRISHITSESQIFLFTKENIQKFKVSALRPFLDVTTSLSVCILGGKRISTGGGLIPQGFRRNIKVRATATQAHA